MPLTEVKTVEHDGEVIERSERRLYTLAELKEGKHLEGRDIVPAREASAYDTARENIARMKDESGWTQQTLEEEISEYIVPEILGKAGITTDPKTIEWDVSPVQGGMFFALDPRRTTIDVPTFLRAMRDYYAGKDWRGPEYKDATQKPRLPSRHKRIDLRSKDAWHARNGGLHVQKVSAWTGEIEPESYDYEYEFSEEFREDCNDFLAEVLGFCLRTLRDIAEDDDEEGDLDAAELNEWRFTAEGEWA